MNRVLLSLSCAIVATTSLATAQDIHHEDSILTTPGPFPIATDGTRLVSHYLSYGEFTSMTVYKRSDEGPYFLWSPESILWFEDINGEEAWVSEAHLSGDHIALLLEHEYAPFPRSVRVYNLVEGLWELSYEVQELDYPGETMHISDVSLDNGELLISGRNEDMDSAVPGVVFSHEFHHPDFEEQGVWMTTGMYEMEIPDQPSLDGNWMRRPSSYAVQARGDTLLVTENTVFIHDLYYTYVEFPILHTYKRDDMGHWELRDSMRFQPTCPAEMMSDEASIWTTAAFSDDRLVLAVNEECTSMDYPWILDNSVRSFLWNNTQGWTAAGEPFGIDHATEVAFIDDEHVLLLTPYEGIREYKTSGIYWTPVNTYQPSDPDLHCERMAVTETTLWTGTVFGEDDLFWGSIIGFSLPDYSDDNQEGDVDGDGDVNVNDVLAVIAAWGETDSEADANDDGIVDVNDVLLVLQEYGA